jgi:hypothetical protein
LKPKDDELLSSWLVRLARAYAMRLHSFCSIVWPGKQIWTRDIDRCADDEILEVLAAKTATSVDRAFECTLRAYEGSLFEKYNPTGNTKWIMPLGVYHRTRRLYGLQCCPSCLKEDPEPFFRRKWRLAFIALCEGHDCMLIDRCPRCNNPINFHRTQKHTDPLTQCWRCRFDLRNARCRKSKCPEVVQYQATLVDALRNGWMQIPGYGPIYSRLFFDGLHQLMRIVATGRKAGDLRAHIRKCSNIEACTPYFGSKLRYIERMSVDDRLAVLSMTRWLLKEWPNRLVEACQTIRLLSSNLLRDMRGGIPYWYWRVVHEDLYEDDYCPTDEEIRSAVQYLRKNEKPIGVYLVSKALGVTGVFRKRKILLENYM